MNALSPEPAADTVVEPVVAPVAAVVAEPAAVAPATDPAPDPAANATPEDWRKEHSGDDEKKLARLGRYSTIGDALDAGLEAQDKLRTTRSTALPEEATDEQLAEYRAANNIPATAGEYDLTLSDGLVIGENDKPMVDSVLEAMHGTNASNEQVSSVLDAYYKGQAAQIEAVAVKDDTDRSGALEALKEEWGPDYHGNKNALQSLINQIPEDSRDAFANARMPDGTALLNDPGMLMFLADVSRKTNPAATVVPNAANPVQAIADEKSTIEALMAENSPKYWKDEAMQARYRQLIDAEDGLK